MKPGARPRTSAGSGPVAGRFEWLQVPTAPGKGEAAAPEGAHSRAQPARRCRRCGWVDSVSEPECFRCGEPFPREALLPPAEEVHLPAPGPEAVTVELRPARELLGSGPNDDPRAWRLRRRSAEVSLLPGFDELLALGQVDPEHFQRYAHQQAVARRALRDMGGATLLADETGLGKTIEAGLVAKELLLRGLARTVMIVVPASLGFQWREEMAEKFRLSFRIVREAAHLVDDPPLVICSYAAIRSRGLGELLRERPVDLLVCDEAHHLKNRGTKQWKAVARVRKKYVLLLSATPFHNRLIELKNLLDILKPGLLGSTRAFNKQYVDEKDPRKPRNLHHLQALLGEVMIRNRREEVAVKLPPRRAAIYHVDLSPEEKAYYDELSAFVADEVRARAFENPGRDGRPMAVALALITLQRELCSSPRSVAGGLRKLGTSDLLAFDLGERLVGYADRAEALPRWRKAEALEEILAELGEQAVVFCEFRATLSSLGQRLAAAGIEAVPFHGGLSPEERAAAIARFKAGARVLLATRAGAEGLNIQFCSTVVNFDLPWNPMIVEQRIGRVHRLGQQRPVTVVNISVAGTIEARILELLARKLQLFTAVLGEVDLILGALHSERSFEELLREVWLRGVREGDLDRQLDRFGDQLQEARREYERIKDAEAILDTLAPPGTPAAEGAS